MFVKSFFSALFGILIFSGFAFAQGQPYSEQYYQQLYKQQQSQPEPQPTPQNQQQLVTPYQQLGFDKTGERTFEGFVMKVETPDKKDMEFVVQTKFNGDIKGKVGKNTNFIPSKSAFKEGEYVIIKQKRSLYAVSVDIPAVWDAKKRELWFESKYRK